MQHKEDVKMQRSSSNKGDFAKDLVEYIALSMVEDTNSVRVTQERSGNRVRLELHVAKEDMGRIIGKGGRVANSIRLLLRVASARDGRQISLDVIEPDS